ncbi:MAG: outer membrane protein assembly factor, partial [Ginsengibacter sp.]
MSKIFKILLLMAIAVTTRTIASAQVIQDSTKKNLDSIPAASINNDTIPTSVNVELENIFNSKTPKQYILSHITVTGTTFDPNLVISISGLTVGSKITLPGSDDFAKIITNLWKQNLVSDVEVYLTQLVGNNLSIEIHITDRPILSSFKFRGISKTE